MGASERGEREREREMEKARAPRMDVGAEDEAARQPRHASLPGRLRLSLVITTTRSRRMGEEKSLAA